MQLCNVLDLDAYERSIKAETLGSQQASLEDAENKGTETLVLVITNLYHRI